MARKEKAMKITHWIASFLLLLIAAPSAHAQTQSCIIGAFPTAAPTSLSTFNAVLAPQFENVSLYVVIFAEAGIEGASYTVRFESLVGSPVSYIAAPIGFGPDGQAFNLDSPGGYNVGFGNCVLGFGGQSILVMEINFVMLTPFAIDGNTKSPFRVMDVHVEANVDENPTLPVFAGCSEYVGECSSWIPLTIFSGTVPVESKSFAAVKSLF